MVKKKKVLKKKKKSTKYDLFWIIPEIIGSIAISIIVVKRIGDFSIDVMGFEVFVFELCLSFIVIFQIGFKGIIRGFDELGKVIRKW